MCAARHPQQDHEPPAEARVRKALDRVLHSPQLSASPRLQDFLTYVVEESLQGRGGEIVGKIIAQDVYGRDPTEGGDNLVRVDARRLRRALTEYYGADGADEPLRIHIDKGQYAPRFEAMPQQTDRPDLPADPGSQRRFPLVWIALLVGGIVALGAVSLISFDQPEIELQSAGNAEQERLALAAKSLATLQAANLSQKGSELLFPIADVEHQKSATRMFSEAIRIDPEFSGGYAGAAHSLSTLALLAPEDTQRAALLDEAAQMAHTAVDLDPTNAWSISSQAWLAFARGDLKAAQDLADRAYGLSDMDARVLDFSAVIFLLSGQFEQARMIADPKTPRKAVGPHQTHLNIYGVASFHAGDYDAAISAFDTAIASGAPVSELTLLFQAAAYQANAQTAEAGALLSELARVWPGFRPETALHRLYADPALARQVLEQLEAAGWGPTGSQ